jgi:hypothetical protein
LSRFLFFSKNTGKNNEKPKKTRTFDLRSKALPLGKTQIHLVFRSLIRTFAGTFLSKQ